MQAASRESYAAVVERVERLASQSDPATLATIGDQVLAVAGLLRREPRLRRVLSDPARPGGERAELLRSLLAEKVAAETTELVTTLVANRWSAPSELLDAGERLAVEVLLAGSERAGELSEVEDELFRFNQVVDANPDLAAALGDLTTPVEQRATLVRSLLEGKAKPATVRLATVALAGFGGRGLYGSLGRLVEMAADRRDRQVAYATSAVPLSDDDERRLGTRLSEMYGRQVTLKVTVDPTIMGGLRVRVGHDLYDGTVLRRLTEARTALAGERR